MNIKKGIYLVTDSTKLPEEQFLKTIEEACSAGLSLLQIREKERSSRDFLELALKVKAIANRYEVPFIINDRVDIALACDADGVHVGATDFPVDLVRKMVGADKIVGATTKTVDAAKAALAMGADYLGVGAIYPTTTKVVTVLTAVSTLSDICDVMPIPVYAIGGLNGENMGVLEGLPIHGVAVVSAIMKSDAPKEATLKLTETFEKL